MRFDTKQQRGFLTSSCAKIWRFIYICIINKFHTPDSRCVVLVHFTTWFCTIVLFCTRFFRQPLQGFSPQVLTIVLSNGNYKRYQCAEIRDCFCPKDCLHSYLFLPLAQPIHLLFRVSLRSCTECHPNFNLDSRKDKTFRNSHPA